MKRHSIPYKICPKTFSKQKSSFDPFSSNIQKQHKTISNSPIMITQCFNHQQQHISATTVAISHEFTNNSSQQHLISPFLDKNAKYIYNHHLSM
jgi:uncharacterized protein YozE (UPF0346 family)